MVIYHIQSYEIISKVSEIMSNNEMRVYCIPRMILSTHLHEIYHMNRMKYINPWILVTEKSWEVMCKKKSSKTLGLGRSQNINCHVMVSAGALLQKALAW